VFREVASGAKTDRAQLRRLLDQLEAGDVLTVPRERFAEGGLALDTQVRMRLSAGGRWIRTLGPPSLSRIRPPDCLQPAGDFPALPTLDG